MNPQSTTRQEMLAALCLMGEGGKGQDLFAFASPQDQERLNRIADDWLKEGRSKVDRKELLTHIQRLTRLKGFSVLEEIHPGWVLEKLKEESPRLFGLLCRFMTGEKVQYLIKHLPPHERKRLPKVSETYGVSPPIAEMVRGLIEKKLALDFPPRTGDTFAFPHIAWMKADDLRTLFWDLGLDEIRKAFYDVEPQIFRPFLSRFSSQEAKEIRGRIESGRPVPPEVKTEAQKHLVSLSLDQLPPEGLFREIGYSVFARSLLPEDLAWAEIVCQKLSPEEGYRLKRILQESVAAKPEAAVKKEAVVGRISFLALKGLIRRYWREA